MPETGHVKLVNLHQVDTDFKEDLIILTEDGWNAYQNSAN